MCETNENCMDCRFFNGFYYGKDKKSDKVVSCFQGMKNIEFEDTCNKFEALFECDKKYEGETCEGVMHLEQFVMVNGEKYEIRKCNQCSNAMIRPYVIY